MQERATSRNDKEPKVKEGRPECRSCGCQHLPVSRTYYRNKRVCRERYCRNCGRRMITYEAEPGKEA